MTNASGAVLWPVHRLGPVAASDARGSTDIDAGIPPAGGATADPPWLRRALRHYWIHALVLTTGGALLVGGGIRAWVLHDRHTAWLRVHGVPVEASVTDVNHCANGTRHCTRFVEVSYEFEDRTYEERLDDSGPAYSVGDTLTVFVNRSDGSDVASRDAGKQDEWPAIALVFGAFPLLVGAIGLVRAERRHRYLERATWGTCRSTLVRRGSRATRAQVLVERAGRADETLTFDAAFHVPRRLGEQEQALIADDGSRHVLLTVGEHHVHVVGARRARAATPDAVPATPPPQ